MRDFDKFELIAAYAKNPVAILGNDDSDDFELVALDGSVPPIGGLRFVAVIGILDGTHRVALNEPLDVTTICALSDAYSRFIDARIKDHVRHAAKGDSLSFLEALWGLNDPRPC